MKTRTRNSARDLEGRKLQRVSRISVESLEARLLLSMAPATPLGPEFLVNTTISGQQINADAAMDAAGNFVVVWEGPSQNGTSIFGKRYDAAAVPQDVPPGIFEFEIGSSQIGVRNPAVAMDQDGDFVVTWERRYPFFGSGYYEVSVVKARRYDRTGTAQGPEFFVDPTAFAFQTNPDVAMDASGDFTIVWEERYSYPPNADTDVFAKRYDAAGVEQDVPGMTGVSKFQVNTNDDGEDDSPAIAMDDDGDFVVAWRGDTGSGFAIRARQYNGAGVAQTTSEFEVIGPDAAAPAAAMDADGDFVITWQSVSDGDGRGVFGKRFNAAGQEQDVPEMPGVTRFQVNTVTASDQLHSAVAMDDDGDFVVSWSSYYGSNLSNIAAREFDASGTPRADEFRVNLTLGDARRPTTAIAAVRNFIVAWQGNGPGDSNGIFARAFIDCSLTVNTTNDVVSASDGVNSLREAVICANARPGADIITVPAGTYQLTRLGRGEDAAATGDLDVTDSLEIIGATGNPGDVIIQAGANPGTGIDRVFHMLDLAGGARGPVNVTLADLTVRFGLGASGGGVYNRVNLMLLDVDVLENEARGSGGGLWNDGMLEVFDSQISSNRASEFNHGGGIYNSNGSVTVERSTISDNIASLDGGGIYTSGIPNTNATLDVQTSTISGNMAGAEGDGFGGSGGGIYNDGDAVMLSNVTISDNFAPSLGGGLYQGNGSSGSMLVIHVTLKDNQAPSGSNIYTDTTGPVELGNTIVVDGIGGANCNAPVTTFGHNLEDANSCGFDPMLMDKINTEAQLGMLAMNGGPTLTHLPALGSPAIDMGDNNLSTPTDQRGILRPQPPGGIVDIGAVEVVPCSLVVTTTADTQDASDMENSLREAINCANSDPDLDTITFNIAATGPHSIAVGSTGLNALPEITQPVIIDGTSESGCAGGPRVELNGAAAGAGANGLHISAGGSTVRGLIINRFSESGIRIDAADGNRIECNYIGLDISGTLARGNLDNGIFLLSSSNNTIGGTTPGAGNVISGNGDGGTDDNGIDLRGPNSSGNLIQGNIVGLNAMGTAAVPNDDDGIDVKSSSNNTIGGTAPGARNIVSGNGDDGIELDGGEDLPNAGDATGNLIQGNFIGTDITGTIAIGNSGDGIDMNLASGNTVGGTTTSARNIISGNGDNGVEIEGFGADNNLVQGNFIGTDVTGTLAFGNIDDGVNIEDGANNTVGGTVAGAGNLISGNAFDGVFIEGFGATGNLVQGNLIGVDISGQMILPNGDDGVDLDSGPSNNTIGGTAAAARNVIAGNGENGVTIENANFNHVINNFVGTDITTTLDLHNDSTGIDIRGSNNTIANNRIWFNIGVDTGISVIFGASNELRSNSIFRNVGLGIDLGDDGVTLNDNDDLDFGPNDLQNFPLLTSAVTGGGVTTIQGSLNSRPLTRFRIEFFHSREPDGSGFGEGEVVLGDITAATNADGDVSFTFVPAVPVAVGRFVTATATSLDRVLDDTLPGTTGDGVILGGVSESFRNTSEFSPAIEVEEEVVEERGMCTADTGGGRGEGNVSVRVAKGRLLVKGDKLGNNIRIASGERQGSLRISGRGDTQINGHDGSVELRDFTDVLIRMGPGEDIVAVVDAVLETGFRVRMESNDDLLILCGVDASQRVRTGEGLGRDVTLVDDSIFRGPVRFGTGNGGDQFKIETRGDKDGPRTKFKDKVRIATESGPDEIVIGDKNKRGRSAKFDDCVVINGEGGNDTLDAGIGSRQNENGNDFECGPFVRNVERRRS